MTTCNTEADVIACYISLLLADVIANIFVADVMTTYYSMRRSLFWLMLLPCLSVADVITTEADVIACYIYFIYWLMLLPIYVADVKATLFWYNVVADVIAKWQME